MESVIRDLQARGLLQILAEPNLVATNGKEASFLAGGEFPVPVAQGGATAGSDYDSVPGVWYPPVVHSRRSRRTTPSGCTSSRRFPRSTLADGVTVSGFKIPALTTRRLETDIELGEGQSFAIGGLLDDRVTENLSQIAGLAHIPLSGRALQEPPGDQVENRVDHHRDTGNGFAGREQ